GGIQSSGGITFSSNRGITLGASGGTFNTTTSNNIQLTNVVTGAGGLTKTGPATLIVDGAHTYSGTTTVNAGTIQLSSSSNRLPTSTALSLTVSGATFDLNAKDQTVGSLAGVSGTIVDNSNNGSTSTLTCGGDNSSTSYAGLLKNSGTSSAKLN